MSRYIRVRSTRAQGCHRAGIFHGVKPVVYDTNELTPDQVRLLRAENNRMLLVDDVDGPEAAHLVPDGDKVGQDEAFTSHPAAEAEIERLKTENEHLANDLEAAIGSHTAAETREAALAEQVDALQKTLADTQGERDAAVQEAEAQRTAAAAARKVAEAAQGKAEPRSRSRKPRADAVDGNADPAATPLD